MLNLFKRVHLFSSIIILLAICCFSTAFAGDFLNSAHGESTFGVDRDSLTNPTDFGYSPGNCAHCHEQHASIEGTEPAPVKPGPDNYALFYNNFINQTDGVCLRCHVSAGGDQIGNIINRDYSYRAGNWNAAPAISDMLTQFSFATGAGPTYYPSSHNLNDISTFIQTQAWGYTANSNPCVACHNPHAVQGDPFNAPNSAKTSTRGWPLSLPSEHGTSPWDLWGNNYTAPGAGNGERMLNYTANYQAPYRVGAASLEPIGDTVSNPPTLAEINTAAQNTTDLVTFCLDCHGNPAGVTSSALGAIPQINWATDIHGTAVGLANHNKGTLNLPYTEPPSGGLGDYVLSCLDCHESHGSENAYLLRSEVNGVQVVQRSPAAGQVITANNSTNNWFAFCSACHTITNNNTGPLCGSANHTGTFPNSNCITCHFHGSNATARACAPAEDTF